MRKIRIYLLARELKVNNNEVITLAKSLGVDVATASSALDESIADRIRQLKSDATKRESSRGHTETRGSRSRKQTPQSDSAPEPTAEPASEPLVTPAPAKTRSVNRSPRPAQSARPVAPRPAPAAAPAGTGVSTAIPVTAAAPTHTRAAKKYYLIDGLNVCNWQKTPSLAPLVTLLIELKRQGHSFLCIFDANTRFFLEELGERDKYEHLLERYDCIGEVPGGTQADDFLLFRAHKTGDAIISNDQYRDQRYRDRYRWLRSVSPRLCKGIVLGGFLILPELDVHARVRDSLTSIIKEFEEVFGSTGHREHTSEHRHQTKAQPRAEARSEQRHAPQEEKPQQPAAPTPEQPATEQGDQPVEGARPRRRRRGRRGGRGRSSRGAGNGGGAAGTVS